MAGRARTSPGRGPGRTPPPGSAPPTPYQIRLGPPHVIVRRIPVHPKTRPGRLKPAPQPRGSQHPDLVTTRDRPLHHRLDGLHTPAAVPAATRTFIRGSI